MFDRITSHNTGFASGGVTCKLGTLCFVSSVVLADSFVFRKPARTQSPKTLAFIGKHDRNKKKINLTGETRKAF